MPTPRWFPGPNHKGRLEFWHSDKRFIFCHSGRRSWKTETAKRRVSRAAIRNPNKRYLAAAPTNKQAKRIFWEDFKKLIPRNLVERAFDGDLFIKLLSGTEIHVAGMDSPDRVEGQMWDGVLLDEYGNMAERVWPEVISPVLADTRGWAMLTGVPEGRNHYYDLIQKMKDRADTAVFHWPSWEILSAEEIETQRANLDELTFNQEFGGQFVHFAGRAYYAFDQLTHCKPLRQNYDPARPIVFAFDFNVDPGVAAVLQPMKLPNGLDGDAVIGEVFIEKNSNTEAVCRKLIQDWGDHQGRIHLYGDQTGGNRGSAKLRGSDWDIIQQTLRTRFNAKQLFLDVPVNPPVKNRIVAVNSRLKAVNGDIRLMVDPQFAPNVVKDLEGVTILQGSAGELDKKGSHLLTHISDAIGYYIHRIYPVGIDAEARFGNLY